MDAKAPVFYRQTDPSEYANFSAYYNWVLRRDGYSDVTRESMYFLHDFVHMVFDYPYDMTAVSRQEFEETVITNEYAASNETEILAHYRIAGLRGFLPQRIFFDTLWERGVCNRPSAWELLQVRRQLIETNNLDFLFPDPKDKPVLAQLKSYNGNRAWCKTRFEQVVNLNPTEYFFWALRPLNYERTVLKTFRIMCAVMQVEIMPRSFAECLELSGQFNNRVMLKVRKEHDR